MSSATTSTESSTDEGDEVAKLFRKALNSRERPRFRRLVPTTGSEHASAVSLVEKVPVYRELEEEKRSKWSQVVDYVFPPPIYNALKPPSGKAGWLRFIHVHFPIVHWLWTYTPKQLIGDTVSGLTVGVTHIPQGKREREREERHRNSEKRNTEMKRGGVTSVEFMLVCG